jgi:hypothetical protein
VRVRALRRSWSKIGWRLDLQSHSLDRFVT